MSELTDDYSRLVWEVISEYAEHDNLEMAELCLGLVSLNSRPVVFTAARFSGAIGYLRVMTFFIDECGALDGQSPEELAEVIWDSTWDPSDLEVDLGDVGFGGTAGQELAQYYRSTSGWADILASARWLTGSP